MYNLNNTKKYKIKLQKKGTTPIDVAPSYFLYRYRNYFPCSASILALYALDSVILLLRA
jgi:hypothetical protein